MTRARHGDLQSKIIPEESAADDRAETGSAQPLVQPLASEETLSIRHAALRTECWQRVGARAAGGRQRNRHRTRLHCARPTEGAETRFGAQDPGYFI